MKYFKSILVLLAIASLSTSSFAQSRIFTNDENIALGGFDVVAYFNNYVAVRGNNDHTVKIDGATYYFSTAENAKEFKKSPSSYQPQYGGYCAVAMATKGAYVPSDPKTFKLRDGKLYLFYNDFYEGKPFNTIVMWNGNESGMLAKANTNWKNHK